MRCLLKREIADLDLNVDPAVVSEVHNQVSATARRADLPFGVAHLPLLGVSHVAGKKARWKTPGSR